MEWDTCDESLKRSWYEAYCSDIWYEHGDVKPLSYEQWCKESKKLGEPLGVLIS